MCCLFGLIDSRNQFGAKEKSRILSVLATECEERGTDATGIAYCSHRHLSIYKRPIAAHRMRFRIPADSRVIMGHTRMTTQGDARKIGTTTHSSATRKIDRSLLHTTAFSGTTAFFAAPSTCQKQGSRRIATWPSSSLSRKMPSTFPALHTWRKRSRVLLHSLCWISGRICTS